MAPGSSPETPWVLIYGRFVPSKGPFRLTRAPLESWDLGLSNGAGLAPNGALRAEIRADFAPGISQIRPTIYPTLMETSPQTLPNN